MTRKLYLRFSSLRRMATQRTTLFLILCLSLIQMAYSGVCPFKTMNPIPSCTPTTQAFSTCNSDDVFVEKLKTGICKSCADLVPATRTGYVCKDGKINLCPAGHFCPYNETAKTYNSIIQCEEGTVCLPGFTSPVTCSPFSTCAPGATTRGTATGALVLSFVLGMLGICLGCALQRRQARSLAASFHLRDQFKEERGRQLGSGMPNCTNSVSIKFKNVGMTLKSNGTEILKGISGYYPPGSLVALMGPSGGGKTSFMNALLGRAPYANIKGEICVNGSKDGLLNATNVVGFVPQDDICHDDLTVFQNLYYNAIARLPSHVSIEEKKKHVQQVINVLGLSHIQNHIVGSAKKRGISGGQKKRVNIGMELVAMPSIIFMDEPTSGLDGTATLELAQCLVKLRESGLTIVCVIHQPRYTVFRSFTHLLLLGAGGQQVYCGRTEKVQPFLEEQGFRLPENENPADWIIDVVSGFSPRYKTDKSIDDSFCAPKDLFKIWAETFAEDCAEPSAVCNAPEPSLDVVEKCKPLIPRKTPNDCVQTLYFFRRIIDQHDSQAFIKTCTALFIAGASLSSLRSGNAYKYATLYGSLPGPSNILAMLCSIQSHALIHRETLQYYREFKSGMSVNGYFLAKSVYDLLCTCVFGIMWALACYTVNPPMQRPFQVYIWMYVGFAFYWSSFGSWIAVTFSASYTAGLLIMVFAPALEVLWSGTDNDKLGDVPIRDLQGIKAAMSAMSSGRWMSQGMYCGELLALPSHILNFDATRERLYNISVIHTKETPPRAANLDSGVSGAFLGLFICGIIFRLLTWLSFLLTKYSQGNTRRSQIFFMLRKMCLHVCSRNEFDSFFQEEEHEVAQVGQDFDHTNLQAVLGEGEIVDREGGIYHLFLRIEPLEIESSSTSENGSRKVIPADKADLTVVVNP